jgi:hypothetical protein
MLDLLMSKATMLIAASLILVSMLGFFQIQKGMMFEDEVQSLADQLAAWVNDLSTQFVEMQLKITFHGKEGCYNLPSTLSNRDSYTIQFLQHRVVVESDKHSKSAPVFRELHLWEAENASYTIAEIEALDATHASLVVESGETIELVRKCLVVGYEDIWMCFALGE